MSDVALNRLRLVQWLAPSFPVGSYAYSQGLEQAITDGSVRCGDTLQAWVAAGLTFGTGRLDAVFLARAMDVECDVLALADLAFAHASCAERALEMREQGRAFGQTVAAMIGVAQPPLPYAVAAGFAARQLQLPIVEVLAQWLHAQAAAQIAAAVKFVPLGQTCGQAVLAALGPLIVTLSQRFADAPLASAGFGADMAQMRHETLDVRIFRT